MISLEASKKERESREGTTVWDDTAPALVERSLFNKDFIPFFPLKIKKNESSWIVYNPVNDCEFEVNSSAYYLLKLCDGYRTLNEISLELASIFKVDKGEILRLTEPLLDELTKKGIVWWRKRRIKYSSAPPPIGVLWDLTSRCNLHCKHCVVDAGTSCEELTLSECCRLIDEMAFFGVQQLILSGGEPMLRKDFFEIAEYASSKGLSLQVATNGTLIDNAAALWMAKIGVFAQVSLDASTAEVHDEFRQCSGSWNRTVKGVKFLVEAGVPVTLAAVVTKANIDQIPELYDFASKLGVEAFRILPFVPLGRGKESRELEVSPEEMRGITKYLFEKKVQGGLPVVSMEFECTLTSPPSETAVLDTRIGCDGGVAYCTVTSKGEVLPCNFFYGVETENVKSTSFKWIWNNSTILNYFRSIVVDDLHGYCRECLWNSECRGSCLATNFARGDIFQSNCHCWKVHSH